MKLLQIAGISFYSASAGRVTAGKPLSRSTVETGKESGYTGKAAQRGLDRLRGAFSRRDYTTWESQFPSLSRFAAGILAFQGIDHKREG
jgi:hypothetical protein